MSQEMERALPSVPPPEPKPKQQLRRTSSAIFWYLNCNEFLILAHAITSHSSHVHYTPASSSLVIDGRLLFVMLSVLPSLLYSTNVYLLCIFWLQLKLLYKYTYSNFGPICGNYEIISLTFYLTSLIYDFMIFNKY